MIKLKSKKTKFLGSYVFLVPALVIYMVFQIIPTDRCHLSFPSWIGMESAALAPNICRNQKLYRCIS